jgi:hypothetical protein
MKIELIKTEKERRKKQVFGRRSRIFVKAKKISFSLIWHEATRRTEKKKK